MEDDKLVRFISSFGISFGVSVILGIPFLNDLSSFFAILGVSVALTPGVSLGLKKINERWYEKEKKRIKSVKRSLAMMEEDIYEKDKIIGKTTTNFFSKVEDMKNEFSISLDSNDANQINDLLYLINANYYEKIVGTRQPYCREEIIDKVVNQVGLYFVLKGNSDFTRKDVFCILKNCYFIKDELKKEIYEEFISSEVSFGRFISHCIENRNVDIMDKDAFIEEKKKELSSMPSFDIFSLDSYEKIIQGLISADSYLEQFGDVNQLEWDMESLKNFLCILLKDHRSELIAYDSSQSSFDIASSFIYNAMCYAVVNQKQSIGPFEMLHTLRNWEKIPFQLRSDVATDVIEKMNLERDSHPFYQNPVKKKAEIISFSKLKKLDNK